MNQPPQSVSNVPAPASRLKRGGLRGIFQRAADSCRQSPRALLYALTTTARDITRDPKQAGAFLAASCVPGGWFLWFSYRMSLYYTKKDAEKTLPQISGPAQSRG